MILLNVRGRKWAKIRLPAVYPIHRPRRLRAAPPTFSIFLKLMRGRKIGSWKPNVVEIAKERSQQLPPFPQSERWGAVSCRDLSSSSSKRVEFSGAEQEETVTGVSWSATRWRRSSGAGCAPSCATLHLPPATSSKSPQSTHWLGCLHILLIFSYSLFINHYK